MEVLIGVAVLVAVVVALSQRRPTRPALLGQYIPPRTDAPILFDSAQIMKCLREAKR